MPESHGTFKRCERVSIWQACLTSCAVDLQVIARWSLQKSLMAWAVSEVITMETELRTPVMRGTSLQEMSISYVRVESGEEKYQNVNQVTTVTTVTSRRICFLSQHNTEISI